jgi:hypothetical protein
MRLEIALFAVFLIALAGASGSGAPSVATHVPTGAYCCMGYANDTVDSHQIVPYVTWANTNRWGAQADRAAGVPYVIQYFDVARVYVKDRAYPLLNGGRLAGARAVACSGQPIISSPAGFIADPFKSETLDLIEDEMRNVYNPVFTAYFMDDVDTTRYGITNGPPCTGGVPWTEPASADAYAGLIGAIRLDGATPKIIINGLSQWADKPAMHLIPLHLLSPANVLGGMCEGCYGDNSPDKVKSGAEWQGDLDLEIRTIRMHKIFWDYVRYLANDPQARLFTFASFMLAWDPQYSIYQTAYKPDNPGQLHVTPETGIVALDPLHAADSIEQLRDAGGTYFREDRQCYYRGASIGACAFVVNSDAVPHPRPHLSLDYRGTATVHGGMVLEGGEVSTHGASVPDQIPPASGWILTH